MINWKWPRNERNNLFPWYVILWRLPFIPFIYLFVFLATCFVFMAGGMREAERFWKTIV